MMSNAKTFLLAIFLFVLSNGATAQTTFGPIQNIIGPTADNAIATLAADLDGDGDQDVISASFSDNKIAWYENRLDEASADFAPEQTIIIDTGAGIRAVYSADLDGDGDEDMLSASSEISRIAWYENRLDEVTADFGPQQIITTNADGAWSVFTADLDGDGDQDVLSASSNDDRIAWHENRLDELSADFGPQQTITTAADNARSVFAADLDGDGDEDVLSAAADDQIAWYENRLDELSADFGPQQTITTNADNASSVFAADLDGDGDQDVLSSSINDDRIAWYENRLDELSADFGPQQTITTAADSAQSVFAADLDGDGDNDVLSASATDDKIAWYENRLDELSADFGPQQIITTVADSAKSVFSADLDGDGDQDVISAALIGNGIAFYENRLNELSADFGPLQTITPGADSAQSVFAADLDGDGDEDVLSASAGDDQIVWYENRLDELSADFGPLQTITTAADDARSVFAADLDGDGDEDVLSASSGDNRIAWYENRLDELSADFGLQQTITTSADNARSVFAADLDGDGDQDVLSASRNDDRIAWYENRLDELSADFGPQQTITTGAISATSVFAADLDDDGDQDVLSASRSDDRIAWYENRLDEVSADFGSQQTISTDANNAQSVFAADLDGDGDKDVLSASLFDDRVAWYENRLDELSADFGSQQTITTDADGALSVFTADLDGDGDEDVLSASTFDDRIAWYENRLDEGGADFGPQQTIANVANTAQSVFAADFDGDGDEDVLSASSTDDRIAWYQNLTPLPASIEVDTPTSPALILEFGNFELGSSAASLSTVITNTGEQDLITTMTLTNDGSGAFSILSVPASPLGGSTTDTLSVSFSPSALGTIAGEVSINTNTTSGIVTLTLTGTGVDTQEPTSTATGPTGSLTHPSSSFDIAYTASDNTGGAGLASVELFYQLDGGGYSSFGIFSSSPISFDTSMTGGDGSYDFYTIATDNAANTETKSATAETSVTFNNNTNVQDWSVLND